MNPLLGVFYHWLGGLASGSFYVPFRGVKKWSWEVYWLTAGVFSWIFAPWIAAFILTNDLVPVLLEASHTNFDAVKWGFLFGMMWGAGGLTFGLTMRYLGMSLGMAIALGYCTVFGAIMPPLFNYKEGHFWEGEFFTKQLGTTSGIVILLGVGVCVLGIVIAALAGTSKEREMSEDAKKAAIKEFSFGKGLLVATFSGIMSAGMSYGMNASQPIADISLMHGTKELWSQLPRLCVILAGGFTTNFVWCMFLFLKNGTGLQFFASKMTDDGKIVKSGPEIETAFDAPSEEMVKAAPQGVPTARSLRVPMLTNYIFCAMAGVTWYFQFFFYSMGETQMGIYQFSSWPLHMASIMIFSSLWGLALKEWKGSSSFTKTILFVTLSTLIFSTVVMGYGTNIAKVAAEKSVTQLSEKIALEKGAILAINSGDTVSDISETLKNQINAIVADAKVIASYKKPEKGEKQGVPKIEGLADELGKVDKVLVNPETAAKVREHISADKLKTTDLAITIAKMVDEIPNASAAEVNAKVITLADAVAQFAAAMRPTEK